MNSLIPVMTLDEARAWRAGAEQTMAGPLEPQARGYAAARATVTVQPS